MTLNPSPAHTYINSGREDGLEMYITDFGKLIM